MDVHLVGEVQLDGLDKLMRAQQRELAQAIEVSVLDRERQVLETFPARPDNRFDFIVRSERAYFLRVRLSNGSSLWALTETLPSEGREWPRQDVSLATTYVAGTVLASESGPTVSSAAVERRRVAQDLVDQALTPGGDRERLVGTVMRVVDHALLRGIDYDLGVETSLPTLRAFGGGLHPERSLAEIAERPQPELMPYIYSRRILHPFLPSNILVSEIHANRWDYRVQGQEGHDGGPHAVPGGTTLVLDSNRHRETNWLSIYTIPLLASPDVEPTKLTESSCNSQDPSLSPDEQKIVYASNRSGTYEIWVMERDGSNQRQLTDDGDPLVRNLQPRWSPDGEEIAYTSNRTGDSEIWLMRSDGSGARNLTVRPDAADSNPCFAPDGRRIAFGSSAGGERSDIYVIARDGGAAERITHAPRTDKAPYWSHDGIHVVHVAGDSQNTSSTLVACNTLTRTQVRDLGDFAAAVVYDRPVWVPAPLVMLPSREAQQQRLVGPTGIVAPPVVQRQRAGANPRPHQGYEPNPLPRDVISAYRHEIFGAWPGFTRIDVTY